MPARSLRRGDIIRVRGERWTVWRHVPYAGAAVLEVRGCERTNRGVAARFLLPFEPCQHLPLNHTARVVGARRWRQLAREALAQATPAYDSLRTVARAGIDLLPFQLEPALAVVRGLAARLLIADEVGLGKTVQAGVIVAETLERCADPHVLIAAPAALREQWCDELRRRFGLVPATLDAIALSRALPGANPWAAEPLIVTSVDYVKRPETLRSLETVVWDLVVVDEAHGLSGRSDRNAALTLLGERARTLVLLTATPHSGDDTAFARMCGIGDLERRFPLLVFRRTRRDAGLPSARKTTWLNVAMSPAEAAMHRALMTYARLVWRQDLDPPPAARLAMLVLMRRACSSAASLERSVARRLSLLGKTPAIEEQLSLPLGFADSDDAEPGTELGAPGLPDAEDERRRLEQILDLAARAARAESKLRTLRRFLRRTQEPAIVFTEYRDTLVPLAAALEGFSAASLHGGLGATERRHALDQFRSGAVRLLLATDAASEGLNLQQRCRLVINLELPWTPTRLEQRVGRVDRIGQRRRVHALHLVGARTSEQSTVASLLRRMDRVHDVFAAMRPGGGEQDIGRWAIAGEGPPALPASGAPLPAGLHVPDLRDSAVLETERASVTRALAPAPGEVTRLHRPFVAVAHPATLHDSWVFRLQFTDEEDELVWEAWIGIACGASDRLSRRSSDIRAHADSSRASLAPVVEDAHHRLRARLISALDPGVALASLREQAIIAAAETRHGRMAAVLVQRGLFDRRVERTAEAQDAALQDMLGRCRARLAQLARRRLPRAVACELAFGLVRR